MGKYGITGDFIFKIQEVKLEGENMVPQEDYSPWARPKGPLLKQRYLPWCLLRN